MFLRLFGYRLPLLLGAETANRQNAGMGDGVLWNPITQLLFAAAAFGRFVDQFTPEEQKEILQQRPFFSIGWEN